MATCRTRIINEIICLSGARHILAVFSKLLRKFPFRVPNVWQKNCFQERGVVSADVSLEQKGAVVSADRALSEEEVTEAIKAEDYEVTSFEAISTPEEIVSIKIEGMTCEHCVKAVAKALSAIDGITVQSVSLEDGVAKVSVQEGFDTEKLRNAVTEQGYKVVAC